MKKSSLITITHVSQKLQLFELVIDSEFFFPELFSQIVFKLGSWLIYNLKLKCQKSIYGKPNHLIIAFIKSFHVDGILNKLNIKPIFILLQVFCLFVLWPQCDCGRGMWVGQDTAWLGWDGSTGSMCQDGSGQPQPPAIRVNPHHAFYQSKLDQAYHCCCCLGLQFFFQNL